MLNYIILIPIISFVAGFLITILNGIASCGGTKAVLTTAIAMLISVIICLIFFPFHFIIYLAIICFIVIEIGAYMYYHSKFINNEMKKEKLKKEIDNICENQINQNEELLKQISKG